MTRRTVFWLSLLCAAELASSAFATGPFGSIHVGKWSGGAYTDDKTGGFSHCSAATTYGSGVTVVLGQNANNSWLLGLGSEAFSLNTGEQFPIDVTLDGQAQVRLFGIAVSPKLVTSVIPNNGIVNQIRKTHLMVAVAKGTTFQFLMDSTGQLLPAIANCVAKIKSGGLSAAGDFSVPVKPVVQAVPPSSGSAAAAKPAKTVQMSGTGIVIGTSGHILTNYHVINGCVGDVHGNRTGDPAESLRIVSTDETNDLALLQGPNLKEVAVIRGTAVRSGDAVIAIGFPYHGLLTTDFTVTTGIISSLSGVLNDTRFLQISAAVQPGNSGGPLLDSSGNLVGVVAAKINALKFAKVTGDIPQNINFAIKTGAVRDFLDNSVVTYQTAESKGELKTADIARNARAYTVLISCTGTEKTERSKGRE